MEKILLLGIGNPGNNYMNTRHNIGTKVLLNLITLYDKNFKESSEINNYRFIVGNCELHCLWNISYVNTTGPKLGIYMNNHSISKNNIIVFHDHLDLAVGEWQYKFSNGTYGHKGLKSIKNLIQGSDFHKISIGIDRPMNQEDVANYVLEKFDNKTNLAIKNISEILYVDDVIGKIINLMHKNKEKS